MEAEARDVRLELDENIALETDRIRNLEGEARDKAVANYEKLYRLRIDQLRAEADAYDKDQRRIIDEDNADREVEKSKLEAEAKRRLFIGDIIKSVIGGVVSLITIFGIMKVRETGMLDSDQRHAMTLAERLFKKG